MLSSYWPTFILRFYVEGTQCCIPTAGSLLYTGHLASFYYLLVFFLRGPKWLYKSVMLKTLQNICYCQIQTEIEESRENH